MSGLRTDGSVKDRAEQDIQSLIGVTLPTQRKIMLIDFSAKPPLTYRIISTEKECYHIEFHDKKIVIVCKDPNKCHSIFIKSTDGETLNCFIIDTIHDLVVPRFAIISGRVYITDYHRNKVQYRNIEGQVVSEITVKGSGPVGITVDKDNSSMDPDVCHNHFDLNNKLYVCAWGLNKVYSFDSALTRYDSELDQIRGVIERPYAVCYHRNRLYMSHRWPKSLGNFVTVIQLL